MTRRSQTASRIFSASAAILALIALCGFPKTAKAQVPVTLGPAPIATFLSSTGAPLAGGKVYTYAAGTSIQQATYTDSTGTIQNSNPVVLDSAGRAAIWFSALAYKIVVQNSAGVQQYVTDSFQVSPFLAGNNSFSGNETHSGTETFNGAVTFSAGGAMTGSFSGSPTFSGNPTFSGTPTFSGIPIFSNALKTDVINGTLTNGGNMTLTAASGAAATAGEGFVLSAGNGGTGTASGGSILQTSGNGGSAGGTGGNYSTLAGNATSGNSSGGAFAAAGGQGTGTSPGGNASIVGGIGGSTAGGGGVATVQGGAGGAGGGGGDVKLVPGAKGAGGQDGSLLLLQSGRIKFQIAATAVSPTCASTGIGGAGTCVLANYSTDTSGTITLTPAAGVAALGVVTLTFNQTMGANGSFCMYTLQESSGLWNARATIIGQSDASGSSIANWDNNAVALTAASGYNIKYFCRGEN